MGEDLEAFCANNHARLVGALALFCGDRHLAEELAQEALLRACERWRKVGQMSSPVGWCYHVGVNLARSQFRRRAAERRAQSRMGSPLEEPEHWDPDVPTSVDVVRSLQVLTDEQRSAVLLRYHLDLSADQAAIVLGRTPEAVRALTHRAVVALREALGADVVVGTEESSDVR